MIALTTTLFSQDLPREFADGGQQSHAQRCLNTIMRQNGIKTWQLGYAESAAVPVHSVRRQKTALLCALALNFAFDTNNIEPMWSSGVVWRPCKWKDHAWQSPDDARLQHFRSSVFSALAFQNASVGRS